MDRTEVAPNVHAIPLLRVNAHAIVEDDGVSLIDTGYAGSLPRLSRGAADLGRTVTDMRRVICTHGHPDHAGSCARPRRPRHRDPDPSGRCDQDRTSNLAGAFRRPSRGRFFAAMTPPLRPSPHWRTATSCPSWAGSRSSTRPATRRAACACMRAETACSFRRRRAAAPVRACLGRERPVQRRPEGRPIEPATAGGVGRQDSGLQPLSAAGG